MVKHLEPKKPEVVTWSTSIGQPGKTPGVLMLTRTQQVLYMSPSAKMLLQDMQDQKSSGFDVSTLPRQVTRLCETLSEQLSQCVSPEAWGRIQVQQAVTKSDHSILLRGCGLPGDQSSPGHRLLLFLEMVTDPSAVPERQSNPLLSERQQAIVEGLVRGLTNKQLADELQISEHTVKEYLRTIMLKVQASTRAGVIAKVLGIQRDSPASKRGAQGGAMMARHSA